MTNPVEVGGVDHISVDRGKEREDRGSIFLTGRGARRADSLRPPRIHDQMSISSKTFISQEEDRRGAKTAKDMQDLS